MKKYKTNGKISLVKEPIEEFMKHNYPASSKIIHGDALEKLLKMDDGKFDLIITSPPYNIGKEYEKRQSIQKYLDWQKPILEQLERVLSERGSICWQVGNYVDKGEIFPLDMYYYPMFKNLGLKLRNRII